MVTGMTYYQYVIHIQEYVVRESHVFYRIDVFDTKTLKVVRVPNQVSFMYGDIQS